MAEQHNKKEAKEEGSFVRDHKYLLGGIGFIVVCIVAYLVFTHETAPTHTTNQIANQSFKVFDEKIFILSPNEGEILDSGRYKIFMNMTGRGRLSVMRETDGRTIKLLNDMVIGNDGPDDYVQLRGINLSSTMIGHGESIIFKFIAHKEGVLVVNDFYVLL